MDERLAECQQRPKKARAREEERKAHFTTAFGTTVPPPEPVLFDLFEEPGGRRPNLLLEPQEPQPGVHTVDIRTCRFSMCLCRRWGIRWLRCCRWSTRRPSLVESKQVIAVPKISLDRIQLSAWSINDIFNNAL